MFFYILRWKANFLIIVSFAEYIKRSSDQLKRFDKSVTDPKCLLKVETTSSCFDNNLSFFMQHNIFLYITILFEKYGLHFFQNDLKLQPTLSFSKYCNLAYLLRFDTKLLCRLNLAMSLGVFDLFALFLRHDLVIICLQRILLKLGVFLGACLSKM